MMAKKVRKVKIWEVIVISAGLAIGLYLLVIKPYVFPFIENKITLAKEANELKTEAINNKYTPLQQKEYKAKIEQVKVHNILDDLNQGLGIVASLVGIFIAVKSYLRNMKAKKAK